MHAIVAWDIIPGEGQLGLTLRQRDLHTLTLHLLHPVGLLTDQCSQPGMVKEEVGGKRQVCL